MNATESLQTTAPRGWLIRLLVPSTPWLIALAVFAAILLAPGAGRVLSFDTFLHVYMGEHMLREGALVETDPGNWAVERPYLDHEWLPQLILGAFHLAFGLEGLVLFTALLAGATYGLIAFWMRSRGVSPLVAAGLIAASFVALRLFILARPFLISWLLAVVWTMLLERLLRKELPPGRWLAVAVPLMWLWANFHAGFVLGFVLLGIFGLAQLWRVATCEPGERRAELKLWLWMIGGGQLALFASALNPYGFRLHAHFLVYLTQSRLISQIIEWQSPFFHQGDFLAALLLIGFLLFVWLVSPRRLAASELLLLLVLLLAALKAQRNLPLLLLLTLPLAGVHLEALLARLAVAQGWRGAPARALSALSRWAAAGERRRGGARRGGARHGGALIAVILVAAAVAAVRLGAIDPARLDERKFPLAAASFVDSRPDLFGGRMFNFYNWGGYLAWRLAPAHRVFINGLQDHHGAAHQASYGKVAEARPEWRQVLDDRGVDWVIYPARTPLTTVLDLDPGWRRVYQDAQAEIFVRAAAKPDLPAWAARRGGERPANVLLVVLDTTRADAVGAYGGEPAFTPTLDRLAAEGAVFSRARTTSAWTLPAHGSLFTGLHPSRHGAHWQHQLLDGERITLAELLAPSHHTAAWSENPHVIQAKGFGQGFDLFEETWRYAGEAEPTLGRIDSWLASRDAVRAEPGRPFFLFVNLMTPHLPYRPPPEIQERFLADADPAEVERLRAFGEREARLYMTGALELDERRLEILRALYRADVAAADARLARLLESLEAAGELDDTLVVVAGDHGENIGDHGLMEHQLALYETLLRVPLILRLPGVIEAGRVDASPVQLVDVLPTVLAAVGVPADLWPETAGQSLLSAAPAADRPVIAEYMRPEEQRRLFAAADPDFDFTPWDRRLRSIQVGALKLILPEGGTAELYDLDADPGETHDLAAERPPAVAALTRRLDAWSAAAEPRDARPDDGETPPALDEETKKALRSLGYLD